MKQTKKKNIHTRLKRLHQSRFRQQGATKASPEDDTKPNQQPAQAYAAPERTLEDVHDLYMESQHDVWLQAGAFYDESGPHRALVFDTPTPAHRNIGRYPLSIGQSLDFTLGLTDETLLASLQPLGLADFCFLDLETSGLRYKDVAFCIGIGRWQHNVFHVKQFILPHEDEEKMQLESALDVFKQAKVVVSFNGKSFDLPRLVARFKHHDLNPEPLTKLHHIDLMYVLRAFKGKKRSYGLKDIEADLLSLRRENDVPGHRAPGLWSEYCRSGKLGQLFNIFEHNTHDIVSLAALMGFAFGEQQLSKRVPEARTTPVDPKPAQKAPSAVHKKLARTYQLRANQQRPKGEQSQTTPTVVNTSSYPSANSPYESIESPSLGNRLEQLRQQVETSLGQGIGPAACLSQLTEIVALSPTHAFGLKHLAAAYRSIGMSACAQALEARLKSALPY